MDFFPQEVLIEILRNVDQGKKQLCLVSKSFYNAFSSLNEDVWLVINSKILNDKSTFKSILGTTRRIRNIEMELEFDSKSEDEEKQVLRIIEKQSKNITQLVLNGSFSQEFLEKIFKLIPKLNLLDLKKASWIQSRIEFNSYPAPSKKMKMNEPEKSNLRQVKKLILPEITSYISKYILDLMHNLDHDTLNELEVVIKTNNYAILHELIEKQPNLKSLKLVQDYSFYSHNENIILPQTFLNNCDLKHLEWKIRYGTDDEAHNEIVDSILKRMKNLKVLKLFHYNYSRRYTPTQRFNIITGNLTKLETLEIYGQDIDDTAIANLNNLTNLRNLTINFDHTSSFQLSLISSFNQVSLPQLESFAALHLSFYGTNNFIERMSTSFLQNVRKLSFDISQDTEYFQQIFRYFPQVESLTIHRRYCIKKFIAPFSPELQNFVLKELNMTFMLDCSTKSIRELTDCFPNIEQLSLVCVGLAESGLNALLRNLRFLKYLKLEMAFASSSLFEKRMNSIFKLGHNLEVVIYRGEIGSPDILKMFEDKFEYIDIKGRPFSGLTMAVNRKILNSYPCVEYYY